MGYIKEFCIKYEYEPDAIIFFRRSISDPQKQ